MKFLLRTLLAIVFILWILGSYFYYTLDPRFAKFIGFGVLILAFVLMPLFIYHQYKGKDLSKYSLPHNDPNASKIED